MSWFRKLFERRRKVLDEQLSKLGVYVINDQRLDARVTIFNQFHEKIRECHMLNGENPEEQLEVIAEKVNELNNMLHTMAVPYGRAGDTSWYAMAMSGWSTIQSRMLDLISSTRALMGKIERGEAPTTSKEECLSKLKHFFETFYIKYALLIAEISWLSTDVSPSWSITVQQPPPTMGYTLPIRQPDMGSLGTGTRERRPIVRRPAEEEVAEEDVDSE